MKINRTGPRTRVLTVRVTPMEHDAIQRLAETYQTTITDLVLKSLEYCHKIKAVAQSDSSHL